jgi:hypothetical protein
MIEPQFSQNTTRAAGAEAEASIWMVVDFATTSPEPDVCLRL